MKFMGSKRWMLTNGLGDLLRHELAGKSSFVDLFTGSGSVAAFVARTKRIKVVAHDLQAFSVTLAAAVIERTHAIDFDREWNAWSKRANGFIRERRLARETARRTPALRQFTRSYVDQQRTECAAESELPITNAYGGHYFSRRQALLLDAFRATAPRVRRLKHVSVAALLRAASECVAAPGHTAQPFQPTRSAKRFLKEAWDRDVVTRMELAFRQLSEQFALQMGRATIADANDVVEELGRRDLVFIDPPYSGVHYSRFYHVLETVAQGKTCEVSGTGRYPPAADRPWSRFSVKSESEDAMSELLEDIAVRKATAVVTFPDKACSNGISGNYLRDISREFFRDVCEYVIEGRFSTLGGNGLHREARQASKELVLLLRP